LGAENLGAMRLALDSSRALCALALAASVGMLAGCGSGSGSGSSRSGDTATASTTGHTTTTRTATRAHHARPAPPNVLASSLGSGPAPLAPLVRWRDQTAAWTARAAGGITLLALDQRLVRLHLHSGTLDAGAGYFWGPAVDSRETGRLVAAFNGGFRLNVGVGGFVLDGRVGAPLRTGLGSVVTYGDGRTDIGSWRAEVPAAGRPVASIRQNLRLLIDNGRAASTLNCLTCWGATLGGVSDPARSALGITADGRLVWAGGVHATVAQLARVLLGAGVTRAVELDINPEWVAGYVYGHHGYHGPLTPEQLVPGQHGVAGFFLSPYSRDFFTVVAR
jgi:hypothetical protein